MARNTTNKDALLTDEQVAMEIERLKESDHVRLAQKEIALKYKRRKWLYQLRYLEKRGKKLAAEGITPENIEERLYGEVLEVDV